MCPDQGIATGTIDEVPSAKLTGSGTDGNPVFSTREIGVIFLGACMATDFFKQAAPANDPTRGLSLGA
jgi:hypothetical protein